MFAPVNLDLCFVEYPKNNMFYGLVLTAIEEIKSILFIQPFTSESSFSWRLKWLQQKPEAQYFMLNTRLFHAMTTMRTFMLRKKLCKLNFVARFCVHAEIQKPCGCNHKQSTAELNWILNFRFHTSHEARYFLLLLSSLVMTQDTFKAWNKRERFFWELWCKPALNHKKENRQKLHSFGSFLIKKCFCFVKKENNAILTRDKLSRCIHNLSYDLWWFLFHLHRQLVSRRKSCLHLNHPGNLSSPWFIKSIEIVSTSRQPSFHPHHPLSNTKVYKLKSNYLSHWENKLFRIFARELKIKPRKEFFFILCNFFTLFFLKSSRTKKKATPRLASRWEKKKQWKKISPSMLEEW